MKLCVFGLGYVGCISAGCFAELGHYVIGVDIKPEKVRLVNEGKSPIVEPQISEIISKMVSAGRLRATNDAVEAVLNSEVALVCVATPSDSCGAIDIRYLLKVTEQIGSALQKLEEYFVVVYRSTMLPGTLENHLIPTLEKYSHKKMGVDFGVCLVPEFLREGSAVYDFYHPPFTLIGQADMKSAEKIKQLFSSINAPIEITDLKSAAMIKYANNTFHGLKVCFANEIGNICKQLGIDSHRVMELFCMDRVLNLGPYYLKPGFAFGGSCLTKDLRAILNVSRQHFLQLPVLESILPSNDLQIKRALELIARYNKKRIGLLGLSFKSETDDLRESPLVILAEQLIGKGYRIKVYDENVSLARLIGANREFIEREIPHIAELMTDQVAELLRHSEIIIVGNKSPKFKEIIKQATAEQIVIDLVRIINNPSEIVAQYEGICW